MTIRVYIPAPLRPYAEGFSVIALDGDTVSEVLVALTKKFPKLHTHLWDERDELRSFINVYLNTFDIRYLQQQKTTINSGDEIRIVPSVAGG